MALILYNLATFGPSYDADTAESLSLVLFYQYFFFLIIEHHIYNCFCLYERRLTVHVVLIIPAALLSWTFVCFSLGPS